MDGCHIATDISFVARRVGCCHRNPSTQSGILFHMNLGQSRANSRSLILSLLPLICASSYQCTVEIKFCFANRRQLSAANRMTINLGARSTSNCTPEGHSIIGYFLDYVPAFPSPKEFKLLGRGSTMKCQKIRWNGLLQISPLAGLQ